MSRGAEARDRQWSVFEALRSRRRGLTVPRIVELTGVSRASVYRYIKSFQAAGVPLVAERVAGEVRWRLMDEALPRYALRADEIAALALAREALEPLEGTRVVETLADLLRRLGRSRHAPTWISLPEPPTDADKAALRAIDIAIREGHRLAFYYRSAVRDAPAPRVVDPLAIRLHRAQPYLVAFDVDRGDYRVFKVPRIAGAIEIAGEADPHPDYDEDELFAHSAGIWHGEPAFVAARLSPRVAPRAGEYPLKRDQAIEAQPDGSAIVRATVAGLEEPLRWLLSWGGDACALEPPELCGLHERELRAALAAYDASQSGGESRCAPESDAGGDAPSQPPETAIPQGDSRPPKGSKALTPNPQNDLATNLAAFREADAEGYDKLATYAEGLVEELESLQARYQEDAPQSLEQVFSDPPDFDDIDTQGIVHYALGYLESAAALFGVTPAELTRVLSGS